MNTPLANCFWLHFRYQRYNFMHHRCVAIRSSALLVASKKVIWKGKHLQLYFIIANLLTTVFAQGHQSVGCRAKAKAFKNTRSGFWNKRVESVAKTKPRGLSYNCDTYSSFCMVWGTALKVSCVALLYFYTYCSRSVNCNVRCVFRTKYEKSCHKNM